MFRHFYIQECLFPAFSRLCSQPHALKKEISILSLLYKNFGDINSNRFLKDFYQVGRYFGVYGYSSNSFDEYYHAFVAFAFYFYKYSFGAVERATVYAHFGPLFYVYLLGLKVGELFNALLRYCDELCHCFVGNNDGLVLAVTGSGAVLKVVNLLLCALYCLFCGVNENEVVYCRYGLALFCSSLFGNGDGHWYKTVNASRSKVFFGLKFPAVWRAHSEPQERASFVFFFVHREGCCRRGIPLAPQRLRKALSYKGLL